MTNTDLTGLKFDSLHIEVPRSYSTKKLPTATAKLKAHNYAVSEITLELDEEITSKLLELLIPIVTASAAKAAQQLADETKLLATELSTKLLEAVKPGIQENE